MGVEMKNDADLIVMTCEEYDKLKRCGDAALLGFIQSSRTTIELRRRGKTHLLDAIASGEWTDALLDGMWLFHRHALPVENPTPIVTDTQPPLSPPLLPPSMGRRTKADRPGTPGRSRRV
jgi:hypothetical protein